MERKVKENYDLRGLFFWFGNEFEKDYLDVTFKSFGEEGEWPDGVVDRTFKMADRIAKRNKLIAKDNGFWSD